MKYVDKINKIISSVTGMEGPYANLIIDTLLIIIFVKIIQKTSYFFFGKIFKKNKTRFNFRKKVSFVCNIFLVFIIIIIWEEFLLKFNLTPLHILTLFRNLNPIYNTPFTVNKFLYKPLYHDNSPIKWTLAMI